MASNVTLFGKDYSSGDLVPLAVDSNGTLLINSGNIELNELTDVAITSVANNQVLQYNADSALWVNRSVLAGNVGFTDMYTTGLATVTGNLTVGGASALVFNDPTTHIQSPVTGNLDIRATAGNVNITANHDVVITTNSASTIRLVGPNGSSPVNISFAGSCSYINFGSTTGDSGAGIKYDGTNVAVGSSGSWSGISNTSISIAGRTVALGGSNTVGFSDLTGTATNSQLANSSITVGTSTLALGTTYAGLDLTNSTGYQTSNLVGTITNSQLANSVITVGTNTLTLGSTLTGLDLTNSTGYQTSNLVGTITNAQLAGSIDNSKLANSVITVGTNTLRLGTTYTGLDLSSSNNYNTSNLVGTITNAQLAGSITNSKLTNSSVIIGNQTIALGSAGNIGMSNLSDVNVGSVTNKNLLTYDTATTKWVPVGGSFFIPSSIVTVSASNTYTAIPAGTRAIRIRAVGAGGGGGGITQSFDSGGGGGAGGYGEVYVNMLGAGMTGFLYVRSVLGTGGAGGFSVNGSTGATNGGTGSNSNIYLSTTNTGDVITNKILELGGGGGGICSNGTGTPGALNFVYNGRAGIGGASGTITLTGNSSVYGYGLPGVPGFNGCVTDPNDLRNPVSPNGGNSLLGAGGIGANATSNGAVGINGGGGGGGSYSSNNTVTYYLGGGNGGGGFALIEFF